MFDMDENTAVITTKDIMNNKKRVVLVFHDTDEIWQFLDGGEVSNENAAMNGGQKRNEYVHQRN